MAGVCQNSDELADLVQEVFLRAFSEKARQRYDGLRDYAPYLYMIARNVLADWARARGREIPAPWETLELAAEILPIEDSMPPWEAAATIRVVEGYLAGISPELRAVYKLRHEECLSQEEAAARLGAGRQTLRTLERRLQAGLAAALDAAGIIENSQPESARVRSDIAKANRYETKMEH